MLFGQLADSVALCPHIPPSNLEGSVHCTTGAYPRRIPQLLVCVVHKFPVILVRDFRSVFRQNSRGLSPAPPFRCTLSARRYGMETFHMLLRNAPLFCTNGSLFFVCSEKSAHPLFQHHYLHTHSTHSSITRVCRTSQNIELWLHVVSARGSCCWPFALCVAFLT